eukprot:TRINITY_DN2901_c0_g1_i4.p1 TRINITY_DN2901_c0_g1~~TRINITY_DN2901_c0_g1_i4.p1  ORF type:complete len:106 (-),score=8.78 TRINITY_DN2901_c0_g1_i4:23-340(-)
MLLIYRKLTTTKSTTTTTAMIYQLCGIFKTFHVPCCILVYSPFLISSMLDSPVTPPGGPPVWAAAKPRNTVPTPLMTRRSSITNNNINNSNVTNESPTVNSVNLN